MAKIKVEKTFNFFPALVWAVMLDGIDIAGNIINTILAFFGLGFASDAIIDAIQILLGFLIFEDKTIAFANSAEFLIPPPFDVLPIYTAIVLYLEYVEK